MKYATIEEAMQHTSIKETSISMGMSYSNGDINLAAAREWELGPFSVLSV